MHEDSSSTVATAHRRSNYERRCELLSKARALAQKRSAHSGLAACSVKYTLGEILHWAM
jgi:hypothetical protein